MGYQKHIWQTKEIIRREYLQNIEDGIYNEEQRAIAAENQKIGKTDYATTASAGIVKPDGETIDVDANGKISVIGGSGHTILDKDGTEMAQRDNLQFDDAIITDDETNNKTIIKTNEFTGTSTEWDLLSSEQKAQYNIVNITDDYEQTDSRMVGATADANGKSGDVPAPLAGDQNKFLRGDATWQEMVVNDGQLTIQKNGTNVATFTANQSGNVNANIEVPTKTSDITNDSGFITKAVNDLVNYYLKSETYTKTEVDAIATAIKNSRFEVVNALPTTDIKTNVIYLVPKNPIQTSNVKDEYINLDGTSAGWEKIGDTEIDLSDYVTTTALNTALADYVKSTDLAAVATSGSFNDLTDQPSIPSKTSDLTNDSGFITSADLPTKTSDLTNDSGYITSSDIPAIPSKTSDLTNDSGFITSSDLPTKTSDLTNDSGFITSSDIPAIPSKTSDLTNDSGFITSASVPTKTSDLTNDSGYITSSSLPTKTSDLTNDSGFITSSDIPAIPSKTSDLTNDSGYITSANVPTKTSDLTNDSGFITSASLPTVNNGTLTIQKNGANVQTFTANQSGNATANITVPTKTSELTNDSGFITTANVPTKTSDLTNDSGFITSSSIPTVNNATLTIQKNGTTVKTFTANANSDVTANITVPTKTSDLTNDSNFSVCTYKNKTLAANATSVTFTGLDTSNNHTYDIYTDKPGLDYVAMEVPSAGQLKVTFEAQSSSTNVYLKITDF